MQNNDEADAEMEESVEAFPQVNRIDEKIKAEQTTGKMSLFALTQYKKANKPVPMDVAPAPDATEFGQASCILRNDKHNAIHKENVEFLRQHTEDEILSEQQRLLGSMGMLPT